MKKTGANSTEVDANRRRFLEREDVSLERSVLVQLDYDTNDFCRYRIAREEDAGGGMIRAGYIADGIATQAKGLALFLPLADCIGTILYDPEHEVVMLTHLGRHNLEQNGGKKSVEFMMEHFGTNPKVLKGTFSPSAGKTNYPLFGFDNKSMEEVALEQLMSAGLKRENIDRSNSDTTTDERYFSHSEFLKGHRSSDGRFAVVAWLER